MAADKMAAQTLRIITSRFSAIKKASFLTPFIGVINISTNTDAGSRFFGHNHRTVGDIACPLIAFLENLKLQSDATTTRHINNCTVTTGNGPFSFSG
ncbi:TPA: hypothetical protein GFX39_24390 [Escherichia coli]|nr:hypothetical protein [Escherichia coli]